MSEYETKHWEDGSVSYSLLLGEDYYCETCGDTLNEATLEVDTDTLTFDYNYGCYDGGSISILDEAFDRKLSDALLELQKFKNWNKGFENKVLEEVAKWYTMDLIEEIRDWKVGK